MQRDYAQEKRIRFNGYYLGMVGACVIATGSLALVFQFIAKETLKQYYVAEPIMAISVIIGLTLGWNVSRFHNWARYAIAATTGLFVVGGTYLAITMFTENWLGSLVILFIFIAIPLMAVRDLFNPRSHLIFTADYRHRLVHNSFDIMAPGSEDSSTTLV